MRRRPIVGFLFIFGLLPFLIQCDRDPGPTPPERSIPLGERVAASLSEPDPRLRAASLVELLGAVGPDETAELLSALDEERRQMDEVAVVLVAAWWAEHDPRAAFDSRPQRWGHGSIWISTVAREWARHDPHAALEAVMQIPDAGESRRHTATRAIVKGWFHSGAAPDALLAYIEEARAGRARNELLQIFASRLVMRDGPDAAVELVARTPADTGGDNFRTQLARYVVSAVASEDPQLAVDFADDYGAGRKGQHLRRRIGQSWAHYDGRSAMAWARTLPAGEERDDVVKSTYRSWVRSDRESAMGWMRVQESDPALEPALRVFIVTVAGDDPQGALDWVDRIEDPKRREETLAEIARRWMRLDPEAAGAWLEGVDLPAEVKSSIAQPG